MKFTYSSGQRPLDGYTIKRGIGRGGFGEVYYAHSDGGKEVALKLVRGNLDVELFRQKTAYEFIAGDWSSDVCSSDLGRGDHWVVMEYVSGEPLNVILNRHPHGLPAELAREWFLGLAGAVSYLHEHGIVHRDLKPGNVFIENGSVKVGDYGLCKFISGSQRTAQTQSVGTVHYMAPEISTGNYNKQIDVYAAGILLYEMLTGRVPFEGESPGEILMKHLTTPPDLARVPGEFVPILSKALSKNPAHRHRNMAELCKEVSAACQPEPAVPHRRVLVAVAQPLPARPVEPMAGIPAVVPLSLRQRLVELCGSLMLSVILAGLFVILWAAIQHSNDLRVMGGYFFLTVAGTWAVLIPSKLWTQRVDDSLSRRVLLMCLGLLIGLEALWLDGHELPALLSSQAQAAVSDPLAPDQAQRTRWGWARWQRPDFPVAACYLSYFGLAFFVLRWWRLADRRRAHRFSPIAVLVVGFWAGVLFTLWPGAEEAQGVLTLVLTAIIVQLVSPWQPAPPPATRKLRLRYA